MVFVQNLSKKIPSSSQQVDIQSEINKREIIDNSVSHQDGFSPNQVWDNLEKNTKDSLNKTKKRKKKQRNKSKFAKIRNLVNNLYVSKTENLGHESIFWIIKGL